VHPRLPGSRLVARAQNAALSARPAAPAGGCSTRDGPVMHIRALRPSHPPMGRFGEPGVATLHGPVSRLAPCRSTACGEGPLQL
jgi:hypothetical protein